jgi:hypothetical protein
MPGATVSVGTHSDLAVELYDMLMRSIEPDLLSFNIPKLDGHYAGETPEERAERMDRYRVAYEQFDIVLERFMASVQNEVRSSRRQSLQQKEATSHTADQSHLSSLEAAFSA